ncbi:MAG: AraC family transcriptional regulator [Kiritimatiellae bacterium]|nr:AraC family transcriptional regulator [Kiritimatiellia bacterium]
MRPVVERGICRSYTLHEEHAPNWTEPLRVIYDHELVLFSKGTFRVEIEGELYACPADSFIVIPPGRKHVSWNTGRTAGHRHWCHFDWSYAGPYGVTPILTCHPAHPQPRLYRQAPDYVPKSILHGPIATPARAYDLMDRLCQLQVQGGPRDKRVSRALLLELLIHLLDAGETPAPPMSERHSGAWLAHQVRERLMNAVEEGGDIPPIKATLEEFQYSYAHLCRLFRAVYGIAPLKYVHALRISRAKLLMRDTQLTVSEIAFRVGFKDLAYFSQLFRKMTGLTPTSFRARLKG